MNEKEHFEKFRAELYMRAMTNLIPEIESAIEQAVNAHLAAKDSLGQLSRVRNELDRLGRLTDIRDERAMERMRHEMTMDDVIQRYEEESFVYFIEAGDYIKIGHSRDPMGRLSQIRKGRGVALPDDLDPSGARILAVEQGGMFEEKKLHRRFTIHRAAGEWFKKNDRLTHYIKSLTTPA